MGGGNSPHLEWGSPHRAAEGGRAKEWNLTKMAANGRTCCHQCGSQGRGKTLQRKWPEG